MQAASNWYSCQSAFEQGVHDELNVLLAKGARRELKHDVEAYAEQERRPANSEPLSGMADCKFNVVGCALCELQSLRDSTIVLARKQTVREAD